MLFRMKISFTENICLKMESAEWREMKGAGDLGDLELQPMTLAHTNAAL